MKKIITTLLIICMSSIMTATAFAGYFESGQKYYMYKKYEKAREMFLKSVEGNEKFGDAYYFLGEIEKILQNYKEAEEYYRIAIENPTTAKYLKNAFWNLLVFAEDRGDYNEVIRICKLMWTRTHDGSAKQKIESLINKYLWTDNKEAINKFNEGTRLKQEGKTSAAYDLFREAISLDSYFLAPKFELGITAYKKGDLDGAVRYLDEIGEKIQFYAEAHIILGDINYQKGYYREAIDHFNRAFEFGLIDNDTEYLLLVKRGTSLYNLGEYDPAIEDSEKASKLRPQSLDPILLEAAIFIKQKEFESALKKLASAERINPKNPSVLFQIGSIYYKENNGKFLQYFDKIFDITKSDKELPDKYGKIYNILVSEHFAKKNYMRTLEIINASPQRFSGSDYQLMAAKSYFHQADYDNAAALLEKLNPYNNEEKYMLCQSLARTGKKEKARQIINSLILYDEYVQKIRKDPALAPILSEMEREKKPHEQKPAETPAPKKPEPAETTPPQDNENKQGKGSIDGSSSPTAVTETPLTDPEIKSETTME